MTLGEKIYLLRNKRGMSQEELAEKLNVSRQTVSNWENDKVKIDVEKAKELSKIFNVSMDELFGGNQFYPIAFDSKNKPSILKIAIISVVLLICATLIIVSAVFIARYQPDETSSTITLSAVVGWIVIACCAIVIAGIAVSYIIIRLKRK